MQNKLLQRICIGLAVLMTAVSMPVFSATAEETAAENLSAKCRYGGDFSVHADRLRDKDFDTAQRVNKGKTLTVEWTDDVPAASVFLSFYFEPVAYTIFQYDQNGRLLSEQSGELLYNNLIETLPETRKVAFRADEDNCAFCSLYVYGEGSVPDYHAFQATVEKTDYMTFAMHPDDDVLFLGAVFAIYEADRGLTGMSMIMSTKLPEKNQRLRRQEDLNSAWVLGLKTQPYFGGFPDIPPDYYQKFKHTFTVNDVTAYAVYQIRHYRPEVVITQDLNGEYGHWQHKVLAEGVLAAVPLAGDPDYQPKGYPAYEPWEVKKLYIHLYEENRITLDAERPIEALGGKSAFEAAQEAFLCHKTQTVKNNHWVSLTEYSIAEFGLAYTTVGLDTPGVNDMFEHIDPDSLSVTPEPTATPTPDPTAAPTPVPTAKATELLTPVPTPQPAPEPTLQSPPTAESTVDPVYIVVEEKTPAQVPKATEADTPAGTAEIIPTSEPAATPREIDARQNGLSTAAIVMIAAGLVALLGALTAVLLIVRKRR